MNELAILDQPFSLSEEQIAFYQKNKFIKVKQVLDEATVAHFNAIISKRVEVLNEVDTPLEKRNTYGKAFLQLMNLWTDDQDIAHLVFSKRIAGRHQLASNRLRSEQCAY